MGTSNRPFFISVFYPPNLGIRFPHFIALLRPLSAEAAFRDRIPACLQEFLGTFKGFTGVTGWKPGKIKMEAQICFFFKGNSLAFDFWATPTGRCK